LVGQELRGCHGKARCRAVAPAWFHRNDGVCLREICIRFAAGLSAHPLPVTTSTNPYAGKALSTLLQGKVAIVTGGNSGIGKAIV
jgi:hypothetical protein